MEKTMPRVLTPETRRQRFDRLSKEKVVYMGRLAIRQEQLGINDPVTHLYQYLEKGETALTGIREDIETDIAERLPKMPFVNYVGFEFTGNDFVSVKDKVSMNSMTNTNLEIFEQESVINPDMEREYIRAKTEAQEVKKLTNWFLNAPIGSYMIFESLPIGDQQFAISRIYRKIDNNQLEGCFLSLYSSSVEHFNNFRQKINIDLLVCETEEEILANNYEFYNSNFASRDVFLDYYVGTYDYELQTKFNKQFSFGLEKDKEAEKLNGMVKVRGQTKLTLIYLDTIKAFAMCEGIVTSELMQINEKLGINYQLMEGQVMSSQIVRKMLNEVISSIASVIDRADSKLLNDLEHASAGHSTGQAAVSHYGGQAKSEGVTYSSNGCPVYSRTELFESDSSSGYEFDAISNAFGINERLKNFGKPKMGVCRISNCPTRGDIDWLPQKTLVGGCDICVCCHKFFEKGKSPEKIYKKQQIEKEQKNARILKEKATKKAIIDERKLKKLQKKKVA